MNITNVVNKLHTDYQNTDNVVNRSVKYSFRYHDSDTSVYYAKTINLERYITLVVSVNNVYYLISLPIKENNNSFELTPYIPEEVYPLIRPFIFEKDNNSPIKYFEKICSVILNTQPITTNYETDINNHNLYVYHNKCDYPFFQNFVRANMSPDMKKKIKKQYGNPLADQIINYCYNMGKTCRFTPDITKARNIVLVMNE